MPTSALAQRLLIRSGLGQALNELRFIGSQIPLAFAQCMLCGSYREGDLPAGRIRTIQHNDNFS